MHFKMTNGEETISTFIRDIEATFQMKFPTIIYEGEETPGICFSDRWTHCLSSDEYAEGILARYEEELELAGNGYKVQIQNKDMIEHPSLHRKLSEGHHKGRV